MNRNVLNKILKVLTGTRPEPFNPQSWQAHEKKGRIRAWSCTDRVLHLCGSILILMAPTMFATGLPTGQFVANNTPRFVAKAKNLGPEDPSKVIDITVWLNLHNRSDLDAMAKELYDPSSSHYHQWLRRDAFAAQIRAYGPGSGRS